MSTKNKNILKAKLVLMGIFIFTNLSAQNVGIGTTEPLEKLQVNGNLLIQQPYTSTVLSPTTTQTKTMINGSTITFNLTDSTGRIYDPGGPAGNYLDNLTGTVIISSASYNSGQAIEIVIEDMDLSVGDSLIFTDNNITIFKVGNNYSTTGKYVFNTRGLNILFKSNSDGFTGRGFSLSYKRLYPLSNAIASNSAFGNVIYFDAAHGIFRTGLLSSEQKGNNSTAMGFNAVASGILSTALGNSVKASGFASTAMGQATDASGSYSTAMGDGTNASGSSSTAMGAGATASGIKSTAMGTGTTASGYASTAMGNNTTASGYASTAMGYNTTASGFASTAMGNSASALNGGSFVIGDSSFTSNISSSANNQMSMRFAGGYRLYSNSNLTSGVTLAAGGGSWSAVSDRRLKENFTSINSEELLQKVAALSITNWNYKSQPNTQKHIGPMAQDFYEAFKLDGVGNDTTINIMDISGVNMAAIQALEKRTADLKKENKVLKDTIEALKAEMQKILTPLLLLRYKNSSNFSSLHQQPNLY